MGAKDEKDCRDTKRNMQEIPEQNQYLVPALCYVIFCNAGSKLSYFPFACGGFYHRKRIRYGFPFCGYYHVAFYDTGDLSVDEGDSFYFPISQRDIFWREEKSGNRGIDWFLPAAYGAMVSLSAVLLAGRDLFGYRGFY